MTDTKTAPIPSGRYGAPDPAPNTPTECPRCGAPAISRQGVAKHALWHRDADVDRRRQEKLLDRLETFLNGIEHLEGPDGEPQRFPDWKQEIDDLVSELPETDGLARLEQLLAPETFEKLLALTTAEAPAAAPAAAEAPRIIAWPEDADVYGSADPDDVIPSSATHSFPGDEPVRIGGTGADGTPLVDAEIVDEPEFLDDLPGGSAPEDEETDAIGPWGAR